AILGAYFVIVLGIGFYLKNRMRKSSDFLLAGRKIPVWATGLAFIAANLGAQEVIGMAASGAKYGLLTNHFYWVGAIPAMAFVGGWSGMAARLPPNFTHVWTNLGSANANPLGVEWFGMVMGLGFVLSFGYWCTDFLVVQRAMAAESQNAARCTPLIGAIPKMFFPFIVILPGLVALALTTHPHPGAAPLLPRLADGSYDYNMRSEERRVG